MWRGVDRRAGEKGGKNFFARAPEQEIRHPAVFGTHLIFVFVKARRVRAEYRQIDVYQYLSVGRVGQRVVAGRHDKPLHTGLRVTGEAAFMHHAQRPLRALRLVVLRARLVDGVVKPQREFDFFGVFA